MDAGPSPCPPISDDGPYAKRAQRATIWNVIGTQFTSSKANHATQDPPDRRPWRRRLLDGEGRIAARRVRAVAGEVLAAPRLLPAHGLGRRRPLRGALLPALLAQLRGQSPVAVPPRPGHRRGRG